MNTEAELVDDEDDDDNDNDNQLSVGGMLTLVFTAEGQCVLEEDDEAVWMSDDDDDFQEHFGNEFLDADQDAREILNWLEEEGWIESEEKEKVAIEVEEDGDAENEGEF